MEIFWVMLQFSAGLAIGTLLIGGAVLLLNWIAGNLSDK